MCQRNDRQGHVCIPESLSLQNKGMYYLSGLGMITDNTFLMVLWFQREVPLLFQDTVAVDKKTDLNQICTVQNCGH